MRNLSKKGLSMSQAQSISNLCNQRAKEIETELTSFNVCQKTIKIGSDEYVQQEALPMPKDILRIGKPYDVTTLVSKPTIEKWSVGTYVVFCKDIWRYKIGDIDIITQVPSSNKVISLKRYEAVAINREKEGTFKWFATKEEAEAFAKTLTKAEDYSNILVFDKYKIGDIVVSLKEVGNSRIEGDLFKVLEDSHEESLSYTLKNASRNDSEWRIATIEEKEAFEKGIKNINLIKKTKVELVVGKWYFVDDYGTTYKVKYNNYWKTCDYITLSNSYFGSGAFENPTNIKPLTDLSEIQKYLPDGHPDKVVVTERTKTITKEVLLVYAKEHYPVGTEFNNTNLYPSHVISDAVVSKNDHEWCGSIIQVSCKNDIRTLYKDGKWAEITTPVVSSLSTTIAVKHWGPDLIGKQFVSEVANLDCSRCQKEIPYTIIRVLDNQLSFKLNDHCSYSISKPNFLKHCKLVPPSGISIPTIQETKSTVNYTVSTALTELSVNIPHGRKTKQVPVITIELSQINCNL